MNNFKKNALRVIALVLAMATLSLSLCSCGKKISEIDVITTDHYSVTAGMLTYSLYDSYYYYVNYFGSEMMLLYFGIDTSVSLKKQFSDPATGKTWFDVFKTDALDGFCNSLALCEAAYRAGVTLNEIDHKFIQSELDEIETMGAKEGKTLAEYIEYIYTEGVTVDDVKKSLEIYRLANKMRYYDYNKTDVSESEINADLKKNGDKYLIRDFIVLELVLSNETEKNTVIKEYAEKLKNAANEEEFRKIAEEFIDSEYCVDSKKDDSDEKNDKTVISQTVQNDFDEEKITDADKWMFHADTKKGDTYMLEGKTSYAVYMAMNEAAMDTSETRNIYTMLFSEDIYGSDMKAKAEEIYNQWKNGGESIDSFKTLASTYTTDYASASKGGYYANVMKEDLVDELDKWLYAEERKEGDSALIKTGYGYHIIVYAGTGEPAWKVPIIETIKDTKVTAQMQGYTELYPPTVIQGNLKYVTGK